MTMHIVGPGSERQHSIDALAAIVEHCDLDVDLAPGEYSAEIGNLLDTLSSQFLDYRFVVAGVRDAVRHNAEMLHAFTAAAVERGALTSATADAVTEAGGGALKMADAAAVLHGYSENAAEAVNDAASNLEFIDGSLGELGLRLAQTQNPLITLSRSTDGVAEFVFTLARLSRHAQLLAVNAAIEAAHLAGAGARFAIVASELRKLSTSTRESKANIMTIVSELQDTTHQIVGAIGGAQAASHEAAVEIAGAAEALALTANGIEQFGSMMASYEAIAETQNMALEDISSSIDQIAYHSEEAADASRVAERLNLDTLLDCAQRSANRWKLRTPAAAAVLSDNVFGRWMKSICTGADAAAPADVDSDSELRPLVASVRLMVERVNAEQREILTDVVQVAVAISLNAQAWQSITASLGGVARVSTIVREKVASWMNGSSDSLDYVKGMREVLIDLISDQCDVALKKLDGALVLISRTDATVRATDGSVEMLDAAAVRGNQIVTLIDTFSSETDLLSLNAAIEAAHAGSLGFSVIAEEIGSLARATSASTSNVSELVSSIAQKSAEFRKTIVAASKSMKNVITFAAGARSAVVTYHGAYNSAIESAAGLATIASEQKCVLDRVSEYMDRCAASIGASLDEDAAGETRKGRLALAIFGSRAHAIAARRPIGTVIERVRVLGESLCVGLEAVLETALAHGDVSLDDLFDFNYREISGQEIGTLGRLFDVAKVPVAGFMPAKYATPWDTAIDEAAIGVLSAGWEDAMTAGFAPVMIAATDLNGFFYALPRQRISDWTNRYETDNSGSQIKRLIEDEHAFRVGRWGLGPNVSALGPRCTYDRFRDAGCNLERTQSRPWGAYVLAEDTKRTCNEIVMGIYVRNMRHGTLRLSYDSSLL